MPATVVAAAAMVVGHGGGYYCCCGGTTADGGGTTAVGGGCYFRGGGGGYLLLLRWWFHLEPLWYPLTAKYFRQALFFTIKADSILSSQAHTLLSSQPPPHSPPPRSIATRWSDMIKLLSARVKEEMWCCEHHANLTVMPGTQDRGCGYFMWMDDLRLHISSSSGSSTPPSYSPGTSTRPSYSPGSSRSAQNLGKAECSNCKFLAEKIKTLEAKIKILEGALEMERHPEKHTLESAAILHELYNDMGKLGLE
ncbi:hypothetical protein Tco_0462734 [Tanacetum coccineum]